MRSARPPQFKFEKLQPSRSLVRKLCTKNFAIGIGFVMLLTLVTVFQYQIYRTNEEIIEAIDESHKIQNLQLERMIKINDRMEINEDRRLHERYCESTNSTNGWQNDSEYIFIVNLVS